MLPALLHVVLVLTVTDWGRVFLNSSKNSDATWLTKISPNVNLPYICIYIFLPFSRPPNAHLSRSVNVVEMCYFKTFIPSIEEIPINSGIKTRLENQKGQINSQGPAADCESVGRLTFLTISYELVRVISKGPQISPEPSKGWTCSAHPLRPRGVPCPGG